MTYYLDLSSYVYTDDDPPMLNVGWLGSGHAFEKGPVDDTVLRSMLVLADTPVNLMRGYHYCEFCDAESPVRVAAPVERGYVALGSGEIHVADSSGIRYAAPTLIIHYILAHGYRPPAPFLAALEET